MCPSVTRLGAHERLRGEAIHLAVTSTGLRQHQDIEPGRTPAKGPSNELAGPRLRQIQRLPIMLFAEGY